MAKFKRGGNGTGSVRHLKGNRRKPYQAVAPAYEDADGNLIRKTIGYYETRQEALDALYAWRFNPPTTDAKTTFESLYEIWKEQAYKNIGKQTKYAYNAAYAKLKPIHRLPITDVKTAQIQFCINRVAQEGASRSSLNNIKIVAGKVLALAMQQDLINKNYAQFVVLPKQDKSERQIFTDFQLKAIENGAENGIGVSADILFMCYTGWRIQEYCNLTVFDYDRSEHTFKGGLKTEAGKERIVPVPEKLIPFVEDAFSKRERLYPHTSQKLRADFYETLSALGIQNKGDKTYTPHTCRHTFNSLLAKADVPIEQRMKLLGQSDTSTNIKTYTHYEIETLRNAVAKI